ncbi:EcsC family protein [Actinomycetospora chiangmaiensis]|uniref:EcsC family protein n=1 Tax=Actinomycetospora chiangmaiensis TaxID=402650 RepID=UPI000374D504|nr:EcsC family protein [Actinomycetospora chiangmaiensis]
MIVAGVGCMSDGDARAWDAVERWRSRADAGPGWWGRLGSWVVSGLRHVPGAGIVDQLVETAVVGVVGEPLREAGLALGWWTAGRADRVLAVLVEAGHEVTALTDLRHLDVDDLRAVRGSLGRVHVAAAGLRGGLGGAAAGAAAGASGAATGLVAGVAALALDTVLTTATCARAVARVAAHYGYDCAEPDEREFALAVLAAGLAPAPPVVVRPLPAIGIGLGVWLSARQVGNVLEAAEHLYTERFLREKYALPDDGSLAAVS